jgi:DNA polymerase elongation subunit (family B)
MVMDYSASPMRGLCRVTGTGGNKRCDMSKSAIQAVKSLNSQFGIPLTKIAVTPMIGMNDVGANEVFSLVDVNILSQYVIENGLEGVHYWSLDRDKPCSPPSQTTVAVDCFTYPAATSSLAFTNQFAIALTTANFSSTSSSSRNSSSPYWIIGVAVGGFIVILAFLIVFFLYYFQLSCFSSKTSTAFEFDIDDAKSPSSPSSGRLSPVSSTSFEDENLEMPNHRHEIALTTFESRV